jgi:hypothetical protein
MAIGPHLHHSGGPRVAARALVLWTVGCAVRIECRSRALFDLLVQGYGAMRRRGCARVDMNYVARLSRDERIYSILRPRRRPLRASDDGNFIYLFEKELTIELQRHRPDLYFLHAAALELGGKAILLVAPSGGGKSTLAWGLLHHGFHYLSDELAPVNLQSMSVTPYPHALCLKNEPPRGYPLPSGILRTRLTLHVPTTKLPDRTLLRPVRLGAVLFLEYCPAENTPASLQQVSKGEAAARLFTQALNPLAHGEDGLAAAAAIACQAVCYRLRFNDLRASCDRIRNLFSAGSSRPEAVSQAASSAPAVVVG